MFRLFRKRRYISNSQVSTQARRKKVALTLERDSNNLVFLHRRR